MIRQRRRGQAKDSGADDGESDDGCSSTSTSPPFRVKGLRWLLQKRWIYPLLFASHALSAYFNIIHDCDEVFNYWEPLHYLLYGYGLQTWEYSSRFALRPYIYLLIHSAASAPIAAVMGAEGGKVFVFYGTRLALGAVSAACNTYLVRSALKQLGPEPASILMVLLIGMAGPFMASTTLLPSTFSMYFVTLAASAALRGNWQGAIVPATIGVVWGWTVAAIAFLPFAAAVLLGTSFVHSAGLLLVALLLTGTPLVVVDRLFYGRWTVSLWNFVQYNVIGGGESALYGVEGWTFYIRNGLNNFNLVFLLAALLPVLLLVQSMTGGRIAVRTQTGSKVPLLVAVSPVYLWTLAISCLPHKEERFLYVVYPLICLCASVVLAAVPNAVMVLLSPLMVPRKTGARVGIALTWLALLLALGLAASRTAAQLSFYRAPMSIYRMLPHGAKGINGTEVRVCVGNEWHRFPSSFFLPSTDYRLAFVKSGFGGLLPKPFSPEDGGTAAAPSELNNKNREEPGLYVTDPDSECDFFVGLAEHREGPGHWWTGGGGVEDQGRSSWARVGAVPFVDASLSPALPRALFIPYISQQSNTWMEYVLLRRLPPLRESE